MNRSRLFCRLLYFKSLADKLPALGNLPYVQAIMTPGAAPTQGVLATEDSAVFATANGQAMVTLDQHEQAWAAMTPICSQLHQGEACCQVYFPPQGNPDCRISSQVARRGAVPGHSHPDDEAGPKPKQNTIAWKALYEKHRKSNRDWASNKTGIALYA